MVPTEPHTPTTQTVLARNFQDPIATLEFLPRRGGIFCGLRDFGDVLRSIGGHSFQLWTLDEGALLVPDEVALRLRGHVLEYCAREAALAGILASQSGWATAARTLCEAAKPLPVILTAAKTLALHSVGQFERAAMVGGCEPSASLWGRGLLSRTLILLAGDTLRAAKAFDGTIEPEVPRLARVDTFHDAADEAVHVALGLGDRLAGVVLEHEPQRNSVTADLVRRVRAQLDLAGFPRVKILAAGELTPELIGQWRRERVPLDGFFAGDALATAPAIPFAVELKESDSRPLARRGLIPGTTPSPRLKRMDVD